jgi:hypothetical protein
LFFIEVGGFRRLNFIYTVLDFGAYLWVGIPLPSKGREEEDYEPFGN